MEIEAANISKTLTTLITAEAEMIYVNYDNILVQFSLVYVRFVLHTIRYPFVHLERGC
jgi:hypothetical protein